MSSYGDVPIRFLGCNPLLKIEFKVVNYCNLGLYHYMHQTIELSIAKGKKKKKVEAK